jgi:hypothetical protein
MSSFELVEIPFEPGDLQPTLEDEFLATKITKSWRPLQTLNNFEQVPSSFYSLR